MTPRARRKPRSASDAAALLPINQAELHRRLAGTFLNAVEAETGIDRRQLRRFREGKSQHTRAKTLERLAKYLRVPIEILIASPGDEPREPLRATEVQARRLARVLSDGLPDPTAALIADPGVTVTADDAIAVVATTAEDVLAKLLSYDTWAHAMYTGLPLAELSTKTGRPLRRNLRGLESRRDRFTQHLAAALDVLLEPTDSRRIRQRQVLDSVGVGALLVALRDLVGRLIELGDETLERTAPGSADQLRGARKDVLERARSRQHQRRVLDPDVEATSINDKCPGASHREAAC
jgi:transcriptional regulator with XRE-family HTH domain